MLAPLGIAAIIFSASESSARAISLLSSSLLIFSSFIFTSSTLAYCESLFLYSLTPSLSADRNNRYICHYLILESLESPLFRPSTNASMSSFVFLCERLILIEVSASASLLPNAVKADER